MDGWTIDLDCGNLFCSLRLFFFFFPPGNVNGGGLHHGSVQYGGLLAAERLIGRCQRKYMALIDEEEIYISVAMFKLSSHSFKSG